MKYLIIVIAVLFSTLSYGIENCNDSPRIEIYFTDAPASEIAEYVTAKCKGHIEPLVITKPDATLSINFEEIKCNIVVAILEDFDAHYNET